MSAGHKFVIADDHPLFRGALKQAIAGLADVSSVLEAGDFESVKAIVAANEPTVADRVFTDLLPHSERVQRFAAVAGPAADGKLR